MSAAQPMAAAASRGVLVTMTGQAGRLVVQLLAVVLLARLLTPADYGLVAMVMAILGIAEIVRDFGLSAAAVQARTISEDQRINLFWVNTALGLALTIAALAVAPLVAALYDEPRLTPLAMALAPTFLLNGLSTQLRADLNRQLRFGGLVVSETTGQALGLAVGVVLALAGAGSWALAGQQVAAALVTLTVLAIVARWRPRWYRRGVAIRPLLSFGADIVGAQLIGYVSKNVDTVIIGTTLGASALGLYNRAFQLLTLPLSQINAPSNRVALPVLSRLQDDGPRFSSYLLAGQTVMLHVVVAIFSLAGALAVPLVAVVLGPQWAEAAPLFQILAVAGVFQTAGYSAYWVFLSKGLTRSHLYWQLASRPFFIAVVLVGSLWGLTGVAAGYSIATAATALVGLLWVRRAAGIRVKALFLNIVRIVVAYSLCAGAAFAASLAAGPSVLWAILAGVAAWAAVWLLVFACLRPFRRDMATIMRMLSSIRRPKQADAVPEDAAERQPAVRS